MMKGDTEIGDYAIDTLHFIVFQIIGYKSEIAMHECESGIIGSISKCVEIAVESEEMTLRTEMLEDGTGVTAATEGAVNVNPVGLYS